MSNPVVVNDSASISTSEYSLPADTSSGVPTSQTTKGWLQISIHIASMAEADQFEIKFYDTVNATQLQMIPAILLIGIQSEPYTIGPYLSSGNGWECTVKKIAGTDRTVHWTITRDDALNMNVASIDASAITASSIASDAITAAKIQDGAIDAATFATDAKDLFGFVRRNTAQAGGTATTIKLDASASATDDIYNGALCVIVGGTGAGQFGRITDYNGTSKVATIETAYPNKEWLTAPDGTSVFVLFAFSGGSVDTAAIADAVWDEASSGHTTSGTYGAQKTRFEQ